MVSGQTGYLVYDPKKTDERVIQFFANELKALHVQAQEQRQDLSALKADSAALLSHFGLAFVDIPSTPARRVLKALSAPNVAGAAGGGFAYTKNYP